MCNTRRWQDLRLVQWPCHDLVAGLVFKALTAGESHGCCKGAIRHVWSYRYVSQRFSGGSMRPLGCQSGAGTEYNLSTLPTVLSRQKRKKGSRLVWTNSAEGLTHNCRFPETVVSQLHLCKNLLVWMIDLILQNKPVLSPLFPHQVKY